MAIKRVEWPRSKNRNNLERSDRLGKRSDVGGLEESEKTPNGAPLAARRQLKQQPLWSGKGLEHSHDPKVLVFLDLAISAPALRLPSGRHSPEIGAPSANGRDRMMLSHGANTNHWLRPAVRCRHSTRKQDSLQCATKRSVKKVCHSIHREAG